MSEPDGAIRSAVRRMRVPDHGPDFWDQLAGELDRVEARRRSDRRRRAEARATQADHGREVSAAIPRPLAPPPRPRLVATDPDAVPDRPVARYREIPRDERHVVVTPDDLAPVVEGRFGPRRPDDRRRLDDRRRDDRGTRSRPPARQAGNHRVRVERDLAVVPQAMRGQRSNLALAVVAVAAVALVAFAGTSLVSSRSGDDGRAAFEAENTAFRADSLAAGSSDPAAQAVLTWIDQLADDDVDGAWTSLGPASQEAVGGRDAFVEQFDSFASSYGAWSGVQPEALLVTPLVVDDEGTVTVVTLIGTAGGAPRADAIPVRVRAGVTTIEAFADAGKIALDQPGSSEGAEVPVDAELAVLVPDGVEPVIRLDQGPTHRCGEAPGTALEDAGDGQQRCSFAPSGGMQPGGRVLTVAFADPDGPEVSARSVRFQAA